jgi:HPt (histidine-containing phosphotransfer) domain-containing protein
MSSTSSQPIYSTLAADPDMSELVEMFVEEMPNRVAGLAAALDGGDWALLGRLAHQIKGAAGSYGFGQLTPASAKLEKSCKSQDPEDAIQTACEDLLAMCAALRAGTPS